MADPSASIASAGGGVGDWLKALAQGLGGLGGASAKGSAASATPAGWARSAPPPASRSDGRRRWRRIQPRGRCRATSARPSRRARRIRPAWGKPEGARYSSVGQPMDAGGGGGLAGLMRAAMQDPINAALPGVSSVPREAFGLQAPINPGPTPGEVHAAAAPDGGRGRDPDGRAGRARS